MVGALGYNFEMDPQKDNPCQDCFNLFGGFRGEDLNVKVYDVRPTPIDG